MAMPEGDQSPNRRLYGLQLLAERLSGSQVNPITFSTSWTWSRFAITPALP